MLVSSPPWQKQAADTAWYFTDAAARKGHAVQVFFHQAGGGNADLRMVPPQDERHIVRRWSELAQSHQVPLLLCPGAGGLRGVFSQRERLAPGFEITSLSRFAELCGEADRLVHF